MSNMNLDNIDRKLIGFLQAEFPLTAEPYADTGLHLGIDGDEVITRIGQLKASGIIRQISPVLDARRLGYRVTLAAMRVPEAQLDKTAQLIFEHPGVSHCYERDHPFNLWFTLAIPPGADIDTELERITGPIDADTAFALPAKKLFKIGAFFAIGEDDQTTAAYTTQPGGILPQEVELSEIDRLVINGLQQDLALVPRPFAAISSHLGMDLEDLLAHCRSIKQRGIMRRFGAAINHNGAGFKANAMTCWTVPPDKVDAAGLKLASLREVSHCYERETNSSWPYNVFAMIHGRTREACHDIASKVSREMGLADYVMLFSTREFKKVRVKYLV